MLERIFKLLPVIIGAAVGFTLSYIGMDFMLGRTPDWMPIWVVFVSLALFFFLGIILHELGHLFFGLLTGYKFTSLRLGPFVWYKEDGRIRFGASASLVAGQCLMEPAEDFAKFRFLLYNLGGPLFNLASALIFFGLYFALASYWMIILMIGCRITTLYGNWYSFTHTSAPSI